MKTCTHEAFGIQNDVGLTVFDHGLVKKTSIIYISVNGQIDSVIDLTTDLNRLKKFVDIIKGFTLSKELTKDAIKLGLDAPTVVKTANQLLKIVLDNNWRNAPMQLDIPGAPQIFGQLVKAAGIGGIVYPSQFTKKTCLAIFTQNIESSDSFVQLEDKNLPDEVIRRLDASNWRKLY